MSKLSRVLQSVRDGSFTIKVLNRFSRIKYVPAPEVVVNRYIAEHYPNNGWKSLSSRARQVWTQFHPIFDDFEVHSIAYVGANDGTMALDLAEAFPDLKFYLIEPAPHVFQELVENVSSYPHMRCFNVAAGAERGWSDMFIDDFSPASSLLSYEPVALKEYPFLGKQTTVRVKVEPLDDIMMNGGVTNVDLVIMDVQGYENEVLQGAKRTLQNCRVVISELSLQALYIGSSTFASVYQTLTQESFQLKYLVNPMEGTSHQILQIDGVFIRKQPETVR